MISPLPLVSAPPGTWLYGSGRTIRSEPVSGTAVPAPIGTAGVILVWLFELAWVPLESNPAMPWLTVVPLLTGPTFIELLFGSRMGSACTPPAVTTIRDAEQKAATATR